MSPPLRCAHSMRDLYALPQLTSEELLREE
jgi:hypothetical protein